MEGTLGLSVPGSAGLAPGGWCDRSVPLLPVSLCCLLASRRWVLPRTPWPLTFLSRPCTWHVQGAGHLHHIFPARHCPSAPVRACSQQSRSAGTDPSPQPLTGRWKGEWIRSILPTNLPSWILCHTTCWRILGKVPQEDVRRVRKSLSLGDL